MLVEVGKILEYARATGATAAPYFSETGAPIPSGKVVIEAEVDLR